MNFREGRLLRLERGIGLGGMEFSLSGQAARTPETLVEIEVSC